MVTFARRLSVSLYLALLAYAMLKLHQQGRWWDNDKNLERAEVWMVIALCALGLLSAVLETLAALRGRR